MYDLVAPMLNLSRASTDVVFVERSEDAGWRFCGNALGRPAFSGDPWARGCLGETAVCRILGGLRFTGYRPHRRPALAGLEDRQH